MLIDCISYTHCMNDVIRMAPVTRRNEHPEGSTEPAPNEPEVLAAATTRLLQYLADD